MAANPVEPDVALHQSLPDLLRNLLRNPVEPDLALHQSIPRTFSGTFSRTLLNLTWLCRPCPEPCGTWPGSAPKPPTPSLEPSPEPCWTWPGSAPKPPTPSLEPSPEPCWTWPGSTPNPPRPSAEPSEPSPEPRWTWPGACTSSHRSYSGLKTRLAGAVGGKNGLFTCHCRRFFEEETLVAINWVLHEPIRWDLEWICCCELLAVLPDDKALALRRSFAGWDDPTAWCPFPNQLVITRVACVVYVAKDT